MNWLAQSVITGMTSFVATNIDDIFILMLFFAQADATLRPKHIVLGQYLGFIALLIACLPGFLGGLVIPEAWIGLLGLIPIAIGISSFFNPSSETMSVQTVTSELEQPHSKLPWLGAIGRVVAPQTYQVAAITFANGGDNVGVYVPLFASSSLASFSIILTVFLGMLAVWCSLAYYLTRHPAIAQLFIRYGKPVVPFVLIGLGIFILVENHTYRLLPSLTYFQGPAVN